MTLQNRVDPHGNILAVQTRGSMFGNRGGRIHDVETKTLLKRRWASKHWIICVTEFRGRQRNVMGNSYTELFFLDELTALAAGHRPCFECRNAQAKSYQAAFRDAHGMAENPKVKVMDDILHSERLEGTRKRYHFVLNTELVDGAFILFDEAPHAVKNGRLLKWSFEGYQETDVPVTDLPNEIKLLTPPSSLAALRHGYQPLWHESAF